jgi:hypothetical protein
VNPETMSDFAIIDKSDMEQWFQIDQDDKDDEREGADPEDADMFDYPRTTVPEKRLNNIESFKILTNNLKVVANCVPKTKRCLLVGFQQLKRFVLTTAWDREDMDHTKDGSHITVCFGNDNQSVTARSDIILTGLKPMLEGLLSVIG